MLRVRLGTNGWGGGSWGALTVHGDGRVITEGWVFDQGPVSSISEARRLAQDAQRAPLPALPLLQVQRVSQASVSRLVDLAIAVGVGAGHDLGDYDDLPTDQASVQFWLREGGRVLQTSAYALGDGFDDELSRAQKAARQALENFVVALTKLDGVCGIQVTAQRQRFVPAAVAATAQPWPADFEPPAGELIWPGPGLPGERLPSGADCVLVTGAELDALLEVAEGAPAETAWLYDGQRWRIGLRSLLPDESTCE